MPNIELLLTREKACLILSRGNETFEYNIPNELMIVLREVLHEVIIKTLEHYANTPEEIPLD